MIYKILISDRSFNVLEEIQDFVSDVRWDHSRNGGCGGFSFNLPIKYCRELTLGLGFNVKIYRRNPSTKAFDLWYQGRIESKNSSVRGQEETIAIQGMGYQSALKDISDINATFTSTEVSVIVKNILDNYIVPNTDITYDASDIEATSYTPDSIEFKYQDGLTVMQTLADLVGTREWGVTRDRKFIFKARSSTVGFRYPLMKNMLNFSPDYTSREIANHIVIIGGDVAGTPFTATFNDMQSQRKWKRRDKVIQNSAIVTNDVASQFANAQFAEFSEVVQRVRVEILEERLFETTTPIPLFQVIPESYAYGEKAYFTFLYSGLTNLQINRIQYSLDDVGNLKTSIDLGQLRPSLAEDISQLDYRINQLQNQGV